MLSTPADIHRPELVGAKKRYMRSRKKLKGTVRVEVWGCRAQNGQVLPGCGHLPTLEKPPESAAMFANLLKAAEERST